MDTELKDKVVIVTGGASGIGKATVNILFDEGAIPIIVDKDHNKLKETNDSREHYDLCYDLGLEDCCKYAVNDIIRKYGKINVLVNNAGGNDFLDIDTTTPQQFRESLERNLVHYYSMTHYAWPHLKKARGNIVFVGSKVALVGGGEKSSTAYAAAKAGCIGLTRELATKSAKENLGIRVNCVIPAMVHTERFDSYVRRNFARREAEGYRELGNMVPFEKRPTKPEEIAYAIVFLASNKLSGHTTGQLFSPDGGYVHLDRYV